MANKNCPVLETKSNKLAPLPSESTCALALEPVLEPLSRQLARLHRGGADPFSR